MAVQLACAVPERTLRLVRQHAEAMPESRRNWFVEGHRWAQALRHERQLARPSEWSALCTAIAVPPSRQPKVLVAFFSRTGTTRRLAEHIARATGAELEELKESQSRRGLWGWLRSGYEGTYRRSVPILPLQRYLGDYDLVFVGSPTWNRALSSPVRGFLEQHGRELRNVALFATCQGRGASDVLEQMAALLQKPPLASLAMLESDVRRGPAVQVGELSEAALRAWERGDGAR